MSIKVQSYVWEHSKAKGSALLLLLAIADHSHDDGKGAYPGLERLANKCRQTVRNTQILIRKLEEMGELGVSYGTGPHGTNEYTIPMGGEKFSPLKTSAPRGEKQVHQISPEPSLTTHTQAKSEEPKPKEPTPRETAWNEMLSVFPMLNGISWQKWDELWQQFPDPRRHAYAIGRARKTNPAKFNFYLEDFAGYDPDKPKTWGEGKLPASSPRYARPAPVSHLKIRTD